MGALLATLTFLLFVTVDWLIHRRAEREATGSPAAATPVSTTTPEAIPEPVWVAGYQLPEKLHYHPGHTWALPTGPDTVLVGMDDFARKLVGHATRLKLPRTGDWLTQGQRGMTVEAEGRSAALVSPVEGEVIDVNREARKDPDACTADPYGRGWLMKIRSANLAANLRNLLRGTVARRWMEDAGEQLEFELMAASGSVLRDGGELAENFASSLDQDEWRRLVTRFLLN